ncbi:MULTISPECIES: hypothetical protein [Flavobacteriaceae]|uniref:hypothetical protein n=1 Tax=Flavobacteriaceae TaxID=49546 RepID=UPI0010ADC29F|nr:MULTISPECIES: hypothetical protein [Flavobacteriaceae]NJB37713.1 hypothetical protein [Croceivirga sp. JEA036]TKD62544.1 hypothetical protein FBT53_09930 [Flavobacterium sp. ASW18X]
MKSLLAFILLFVGASATQPTPDQPVSEKSIQGTWELESFYNYDDGINVTDTIIKANGYRQIKMYFNGYIMWSRFVPEEPNGRFGYGTYKITDNKLIETIEYGDAQMMKSLDTMRVFTFELKLKDKVYSQINLDEEGQRTFSENYRKID